MMDILGNSFFTRAENLEFFYLKIKLSVRSYQTVLVQSAPVWCKKKNAPEDTVPFTTSASCTFCLISSSSRRNLFTADQN
jgi:hypothetical protein